jgi:hypothetical protein
MGIMAKHLLERLADANQNDQDKDDALQAALLLATYGAVHDVVGGGILPTSLFGLSYDHKRHRVKLEDLGGVSPARQEGTSTISALDMIFACHARDMPLIWEGDTGTGKTITSEAYLKTVLPDESSVQMSLSLKSFADSPKSPFEESVMNNGMPVSQLNQVNLRRICAMYIDELNLGDPNELLSLSYGKVLLSKERGTAGLLIPMLTPHGVKYDEEELKRLWVSGSQNPPRSRDAQFSGLELTASMKNRYLILPFPSIQETMGSTQWLANNENGLHEKFLHRIAERYQELTGRTLDPAELKEDWLGMFAYTMNSKRTEKAIISSTLEFGDLVMAMLGENITRFYDNERNIAAQWQNTVPAGTNFSLNETLQDTEELKRIQKVVSAFGKPLMPRDTGNIKSLADLLSTVRALKTAFESDKPLATYMGSPHFITVEDVSAAATLLARNKQVSAEDDPQAVVNSVLKEYTGLMDELGTSMRIKGYKPFTTEDTSKGIKHQIYTAALGGASNVDEIVKNMNLYVGNLKNLTNGSDIRKVIVARTVGDLATAAGFIMQHKTEIDKYLGKGTNVRGYIEDLFEKAKRNPNVEDIYIHRLPRVL